MVEVFKTNVTSARDAAILVDKIHKSFEHYIANFDLEDCDRILRIQNMNGPTDNTAIVNVLAEYGFEAVALTDEVPA